jgi:hypothetical protein
MILEQILRLRYDGAVFTYEDRSCLSLLALQSVNDQLPSYTEDL